MRMISLMIPEKMLDEIRVVSKDTGLSVSEHIRRAVTLYLESLNTNIRYVVRETQPL